VILGDSKVPEGKFYWNCVGLLKRAIITLGSSSENVCDALVSTAKTVRVNLVFSLEV